MTGLYLEDLVVGARFVSGAHTLDADQITAFARQFDPQPFHLNEAAAITMSLLVKSGMPIAGGLIGAGGELTWPRPTRPGDTLTVESEVLAVAPSRTHPERGTVTVRSLTRNQKGEIVQDMTSCMLAWRRPHASTGSA